MPIIQWVRKKKRIAVNKSTAAAAGHIKWLARCCMLADLNGVFISIISVMGCNSSRSCAIL